MLDQEEDQAPTQEVSSSPLKANLGGELRRSSLSLSNPYPILILSAFVLVVCR